MKKRGAAEGATEGSAGASAKRRPWITLKERRRPGRADRNWTPYFFAFCSSNHCFNGAK